MKIELGTIRQSPFVGIFSVATERVILAPKNISKKEEKKMANLFGIEIVKASIANSALLGVLSAANSKGIVAGGVIENREKRELEQAGFKVKKVEGITAIGNLLAVNDSKGICSRLFSKKQVKEIERFLGIDLMQATVAGTDVVGSSIVATNKGFVVNKMVTKEEANAIEKHFDLPGARATANAGDSFVGNSVIANSEAAFAGIATTGFELSRLDEGLRG